ncbi:hypothetical protein LS684_10630 [Cytobacillus spongiae]|uniref:hypothetical protein n=1 Tax=Cytobacillus spongiae TaxID=2901381 RepID=UPI001F28667B|nr:hypothetical protein [Cytobacillus spongiae]UII54158.1 hypothetical protein LS684_10630 [Cytobacillus spongiae]
MQNTEQVNQLGTIGLYLFIILTVYKTSNLLTFFPFEHLLIIVSKSIIVGILSFSICLMLLRRFTEAERIVVIVAMWSFTLYAPVVCMHARRTAVNRVGPAPYVLLVVPLIILWLINYVHVWLTLSLQQ